MPGLKISEQRLGDWHNTYLVPLHTTEYCLYEYIGALCDYTSTVFSVHLIYAPPQIVCHNPTPNSCPRTWGGELGPG